MDLKSKIILIAGPTASGKSKFAIQLAKKINGEIINADSMQVYKEVKILSARPNDKSIKHHLYGFLSVKKNFSTGSWYKLAAKKIKEINKKGRIALVVGGTGLYFKALTDGLSEIPEVPKGNMNQELDNICEECKKEDESVSQNLIMHGYKICNSCKLSKNIFPV